MKALSKKRIRDLARVCELPVITIYLPLGSCLLRPRECKARYEHLLSQARQTLIHWWTDEDQANQLLAPAYEVLSNTEIWDNTGTLAFFITSRGNEIVLIPDRVEEFFYVGPHLHITPLLSQFVGSFGPFESHQVADQVGGKISDDLQAIFSAIHENNVAGLQIVKGKSAWGEYGDSNHGIILHQDREENDEELINMLAVLAISRDIPWQIVSDCSAQNAVGVKAIIKSMTEREQKKSSLPCNLQTTFQVS